MIKALTIVTYTLLFLSLNGCATKNSQGEYESPYSYHPYNHNQRVTAPREVENREREVLQYRRENPIEKLIASAKSLLGSRYKYGAIGPYQYDCSGFTQYVFLREGIRLPRVSKQQAQVGTFVPPHQIVRGDLIFFDSKSSSEISHVGLYLGRGEFIHASSSKGRVTIGSLSSSYYQKHLKWGRRFIQNRRGR